MTRPAVNRSLCVLVLLSWTLLLSGCWCPALMISHAKEPSGPTAAVDKDSPLRTSLRVQSDWGMPVDKPVQDDPGLQEALVRQLTPSSGFVQSTSGDFDLVLEVLRRELDTGIDEFWSARLISNPTFGLIPVWYSGELALEVTARNRSGDVRRFTERDGYTAFVWLPALPLVLIWNSSRVFDGMAKTQFRRVLEKLAKDPAWVREAPAATGAPP